MLGAEGIAVGMATTILPHNFGELLEAMVAILKGERIELYPDFPQGGLIDVAEYQDGVGRIRVRAKIEKASGVQKLVIREVPFSTTTTSLIASIEAAVQKGKVSVSKIGDFTTEQVEIGPLVACNSYRNPHLVADMERLRLHLGIDEWIVFGGSWGSTLALAYAETHPSRCLALVLRGIFLCRKLEIDWFLYGMRFVYPEAWRKFSSFIPEAERGDLLGAYARRLNDPDRNVHMPAAHQWSIYEGSCSTLMPSPSTVAHYSEDIVAFGLARIEAHYFHNNIFLPDNSLLDNASKIKQIPGVIVQGRYDMVCPIISADDLHRAWPQAEYIIVPDAGHSAWEPGITAQLVAAMEKLKSRAEVRVPRAE